MPKIEKEYEHTRPFLTVAYDPLRLLVRQATTKGYIECYRGGVSTTITCGFHPWVLILEDDNTKDK